MLIRKNCRGFTLVELLVVMVILGILTTVIAGNFVTSKAKARDAKRKSDLKQLTVALEAYYNDKGIYPSSLSGEMRVRDAENHYTTVEWGATMTVDGNVYMAETPVDPSSSNTYQYFAEADGSAYLIFSTLENTKDTEYLESITNATGCHFGVSSPNITVTTQIAGMSGSCSTLTIDDSKEERE